jgi:hypothetical protein
MPAQGSSPDEVEGPPPNELKIVDGYRQFGLDAKDPQTNHPARNTVYGISPI